MKNKLIDLSWTLSSDTPLFPGDPAISIESIRSVPTDGYKITTWKSGMHVGTHLDAPSHFLVHGGDVAGIALEKVVGPATVIVVNAKNSIVPTQAIAKAYREANVQTPILLISTGWSVNRYEPRYFTEFYGFETSLLAFLEEHRITTLGVDMPSVKFGANDFSGIHQALLSQGIVIIENLVNLALLPSGSMVFAAPLKLSGFDGSMIRAVAVVNVD